MPKFVLLKEVGSGSRAKVKIYAVKPQVTDVKDKPLTVELKAQMVLIGEFPGGLTEFLESAKRHDP